MKTVADFFYRCSGGGSIPRGSWLDYISYTITSRNEQHERLYDKQL